MTSSSERRWSGPIPNQDLTLEVLPEPGAPWSDLVHFATTFDGYAREAGVDELQAFANEEAALRPQHM